MLPCTQAEAAAAQRRGCCAEVSDAGQRRWRRRGGGARAQRHRTERRGVMCRALRFALSISMPFPATCYCHGRSHGAALRRAAAQGTRSACSGLKRACRACRAAAACLLAPAQHATRIRALLLAPWSRRAPCARAELTSPARAAARRQRSWTTSRRRGWTGCCACITTRTRCSAPGAPSAASAPRAPACCAACSATRASCRRVAARRYWHLRVCSVVPHVRPSFGGAVSDATLPCTD